MTTPTATAVKYLLEIQTTLQVRPRFEGSNINTWIGFKHVNYLVEEAVLEHFRNAGLPSRELFEEYGLGVDVVDLDTRILHAFHQDDVARAVVVPVTKDGDTAFGFSVTLYVERDGKELKAVTSKAKVSLRVDDYLAAVPVPAELQRFAVARLGSGAERSVHHGAEAAPAANTALSAGRGTTGADPVLEQLLAGANAFGWKWRIPYPYCHFNERLALSGYLRQVEEVVDLFLADRGISIKTLLDDRKWIPVVPRSQIQFLDEALMEEDLYTVFTVEEVFKDFTYTARTDFYVVRDGRLVQTATGRITHGYAVFENRRDWSLVGFDERVVRALNGEPAAG
ncbi:thioesterase family protein [Streptomyces sp. NBC_01408]|uniref:thioesterase family protein n=1 Tax=Streptomyces sp. NBC_01408 TaxID=2903855 RepID=UPI00225000DE|nr:thioesterase family protein [Streptomyces sp. NBC_01408]MCX4693184.1 thioesterase family protein [Streptomyces sp. NBC_01408]